MPGTIWHTEQPAFVKITMIGSSPVTNGTISGASATTGGTGTGVTGGDLVERRANSVPSTNTTIMRGVMNRSGMEPVQEKFSRVVMRRIDITS
jgi:hypothetical protein